MTEKEKEKVLTHRMILFEMEVNTTTFELRLWFSSLIWMTKIVNNGADQSYEQVSLGKSISFPPPHFLPPCSLPPHLPLLF